MRTLLLIIALAAPACFERNAREDINPPPRPHPAPIEPERSCMDACMHMQDLGCQGWRGSPGEDEIWLTKDDVSCTRVCTDVEIEAIEAPGLSLHPDCVAAAASCGAADECFR